MGFVISRSGVRVTPLAPQNAPKTIVFGAFCYVKSSCFEMARNFDPHRDPRRHKFQSPRFARWGKARSFRCASFSRATHVVGLARE